MATEKRPTHKPSGLIERVIRHWSAKGINTRPGVTETQIESFEARHQVVLPPDLREYFGAVDGMEDGVIDPDGFTFLPLHPVKSIPEELAHFRGIPDYSEIMQILPDPERWFVIVDYLLCSAVYAIRLSGFAEDAPVLWIGGNKHHRVVAASFSFFLEAYIANPEGLL